MTCSSRERENSSASSSHVGPGSAVGESEGKAILWNLDLLLGVKGRLGQIVPSRLSLHRPARSLAADSAVWCFDGIWTTTRAATVSRFESNLTPPPAREPRHEHKYPRGNVWICGMSEYRYMVWDGTSMYWQILCSDLCDDSVGVVLAAVPVRGLDPDRAPYKPVQGLYCAATMAEVCGTTYATSG